MGLRSINRNFIFLILFFSACANPGTEVLNPGTSPKPLQFKTSVYDVKLTLPAGWTFIEYGPGRSPGSEVFIDIDSQTITVASFAKGQTRITAFFSTLGQGQGLYDFVRQRRPFGDIDLQQTTTADGTPAFVAVFNQAEPGERGGIVFDASVSILDQILWMRAEFVGTQQEVSRDVKEFDDILSSLEIIQ